MNRTARGERGDLREGSQWWTWCVVLTLVGCKQGLVQWSGPLARNASALVPVSIACDTTAIAVFPGTSPPFLHCRRRSVEGTFEVVAELNGRVLEVASEVTVSGSAVRARVDSLVESLTRTLGVHEPWCDPSSLAPNYLWVADSFYVVILADTTRGATDESWNLGKPSCK